MDEHQKEEKNPILKGLLELILKREGAEHLWREMTNSSISQCVRIQYRWSMETGFIDLCRPDQTHPLSCLHHHTDGLRQQFGFMLQCLTRTRIESARLYVKINSSKTSLWLQWRIVNSHHHHVWSDDSHSLTYWVTLFWVSISIDFTDVTLVSVDAYWRLYWSEWGYWWP